MKRRPGFWLIILMGCCVAGSAGVARAQITVTVTSSVAITVSAGASIPNAGAFSVTNNSTSTITINSVNITASNPNVFDSLTLTGQVPGGSAEAVPSSPDPPGTSNTFDFTTVAALNLLAGQTATFSLSGTASTSPAATPTPSSSIDLRNRVAYAAIMWPSTFNGSKAFGLLTAAMLGILLITGKLRRRHLVLLALVLILAATEVGCGNTTGASQTSDQTVQTVSVSSGGAATGLPANLGSITVQ